MQGGLIQVPDHRAWVRTGEQHNPNSSAQALRLPTHPSPTPVVGLHSSARASQHVCASPQLPSMPWGRTSHTPNTHSRDAINDGWEEGMGVGVWREWEHTWLWGMCRCWIATGSHDRWDEPTCRRQSRHQAGWPDSRSLHWRSCWTVSQSHCTSSAREVESSGRGKFVKAPVGESRLVGV